MVPRRASSTRPKLRYTLVTCRASCWRPPRRSDDATSALAMRNWHSSCNHGEYEHRARPINCLRSQVGAGVGAAGAGRDKPCNGGLPSRLRQRCHGTNAAGGLGGDAGDAGSPDCTFGGRICPSRRAMAQAEQRTYALDLNASRRIANPTPQGAIGSSVARLDLTKPTQRRGGRASPRDGGSSWAGCVASVSEQGSRA